MYYCTSVTVKFTGYMPLLCKDIITAYLVIIYQASNFVFFNLRGTEAILEKYSISSKANTWLNIPYYLFSFEGTKAKPQKARPNLRWPP